MKIELRDSPFDALQELQHYQQQVSRDFSGKYGASTNFIGTMRDFNEGDEVSAMHLEHYAGMTEKVLKELCDVSMIHWDLLDILIVHRYGEIKPDENIVLIAVWSAHRSDSFEACRFLIESLKSKVPLWKRETLASGERWVDKNTPA
jgi:molybdopterin synthase catalytic subunit